MSESSCEFIDGCPMFRYFRNTAKLIYQELYCNGKFTDCERRTRRMAGKPVPANLLPNGAKLWRDEEKPPPLWE
ncbi:MAG: hypothetical protein HY866_15495 [Chloroflexi bacterium]|nr:hypothetical protein [Chloroflexota bacterium]